jgi:hypothetical protein
LHIFRIFPCPAQFLNFLRDSDCGKKAEKNRDPNQLDAAKPSFHRFLLSDLVFPVAPWSHGSSLEDIDPAKNDP